MLSQNRYKPGDLFSCNGDFYEVTKTTGKTVTIRPIESRFVGYADEYGCERKFLPVPHAFKERCIWWPDGKAEKRCKVFTYSTTGERSQDFVKICSRDGYLDAYAWDGTPDIMDTYN